MKLKEIYKRAKKINPLYINSFEDFISDFGNCRDCFPSPHHFRNYEGRLHGRSVTHLLKFNIFRHA